MTDPKNPSSVPRRTVFAGAGAAGALVGAAALLPAVRQAGPDQTDAKAPPEQGGGYQVTAHVLRYYQTARV